MPNRIRPMTPKDFAAAADIVEDNPLWARYRFGAKEAHTAFEKALDQPENTLIVAEDDAGQIAGFAWYQPRGGLVRGGYLRLIGVAPTHQSKGIGRLLLRAVEQGCPGNILLLLVSHFNAEGIKFYEREGYQRVGKFEAFVLEDVDEILMWKRF